MTEAGRVVLVGAGPGDPELMTLRGARALGRADVVLYDELATEDLLDLAPEHARRINVGKRGHEEPTRTQEDINALLVAEARAGNEVVRLKGGDPFVFGRGAEEASACAEAGIAFEIVPGVSSAVAALAYAGIPVTDRRHSASFAVVTGHKDRSAAAEATRWGELGRAADTLVILMGMRNLARIVDEILAGGLDPETPAAAVMNGSMPGQTTCVSTLSGLPAAVEAAGLRSPAAIVIGDVVGLRTGLSWWERQPLFGKRVLVTRARDQAAELSAALRGAGAEPVLAPMIELVAAGDDSDQSEIRHALGQLGHYDAIIFTSSNAVRFFDSARLELKPTEDPFQSRAAGSPNPPRVFCVGERTATAAIHAGLPVFRVASGRSDAEALLAQIKSDLLELASGQRILIPRSRIARTVIADGLREAGGQVDSVAFYDNRCPEFDVEGLRDRLRRDELFALTFTSPSTVDHFWACLDEESREAAARCMIAAIGRTTAAALARLGLEAAVIPERPDVRELVAGLETAAAGRAGSAD